MRKSTKAFLLSALVFPGAGHLVLEKVRVGYGLIIIAALATLTIFHHVLSSALEIMERVRSGEIPPDYLLIRQLVSDQQAVADTGLLNVAIVVLVISWLVGMIDIWRTAR